jgi:hypothetical protein
VTDPEILADTASRLRRVLAAIDADEIEASGDDRARIEGAALALETIAGVDSTAI